MGKRNGKTTSKSKTSKAATDRPSLWRRAGGWALSRPGVHVSVWLAVAAAMVAGTVALSQAEAQMLGPNRNGEVAEIRIRLADRPAWLPSYVVRKVIASCRIGGRGFYDDGLVTKVHEDIAQSPWVRSVQSVRKRLCRDDRLGLIGVVEISCTFRRPVAAVRLDDRFGRASQSVAYVDRHGVVLPYGEVPKFIAKIPDRDGRISTRTYATLQAAPPQAKVYNAHYPLIKGVMQRPPAHGEAWASRDLHAGLRLLSLLADRPYANQITVVDIRNFDGRISQDEAHLRMLAQIGRSKPTTIVFGRFPNPRGDWVISPERKLSYLDSYFTSHDQRLAGLNGQLDLRYDSLHVSRDN